MINAGELRERVYIERRNKQSDEYGNNVDEWRKIHPKPFAANIRPLRGRESEIAGANTGTQLYNVTIRWRRLSEKVTPKDRIVNARTGEAYNIHTHADFTERNRYIELMCEAGTVHG